VFQLRTYCQLRRLKTIHNETNWFEEEGNDQSQETRFWLENTVIPSSRTFRNIIGERTADVPANANANDSRDVVQAAYTNAHQVRRSLVYRCSGIDIADDPGKRRCECEEPEKDGGVNDKRPWSEKQVDEAGIWIDLGPRFEFLEV
jgi:hypothetical protein